MPRPAGGTSPRGVGGSATALHHERGGRLLLNSVFYNPVGHVAESLKVAKGLADCNAGTAVSLLLNATAPYELAEACPWIARVYPIRRAGQYHPARGPDDPAGHAPVGRRGA
jgi:hypothetical protein